MSFLRFSKLALLAIALVAVGCAPPASGRTATTLPTEPPGGESTLANTQWTLVSFGAPGEESPVVEGTAVTLEFGADGRAGGSGGCNMYGGGYQVQDSTLTFSDITSTLRACADETVMEQEAEYFEALNSAGAFELTDGRLKISYDAGRSALNFVEASAAQPTQPGATPGAPASPLATP